MSADSSPVYFISDLHLEASRPLIAEAFKNFLTDTAKDAGAIYILGDLFDSWFGDDNNPKFIRDIKRCIKETAERGVKVYFLHGNRDFLIGEQFAREANLALLDEYTLIDLYGEKVLLLHGDTLCSEDIAYQAYRKKVRSDEWQENILSYPLWVRRLIAAYIRFRSRKANNNKVSEIMDVTTSTVAETFKNHHIKKMIHGHTHRPKKHQLELDNVQHERIVLGDWEEFGWYLRADPQGQELVRFPITATA
nr:UDP-2,3-diacylglucosamine diphosphatase [Agarilytica rhodophyticola]